MLEAIASPPVARSTPPRKNAALTALLRPGAEAMSTLLEPASLHSTLINVAVPLPAADPMSILVVPSSAPDPEVKASERLKLAGRPTVEVLFIFNYTATTGCVASGEP